MKVIELLESRGEDAIAFADYLEGPILPRKLTAAFQDLGHRLMQKGWHFYATPNARFIEPAESGFAIGFPHTKSAGLRQRVHVMWSGYHDGGMKVTHRDFALKDLEGPKLEEKLAFVKDLAINMKRDL